MLWQQLSIPVRNSDTRADRCKFTVVSVKHNIQSTEVVWAPEGRRQKEKTQRPNVGRGGAWGLQNKNRKQEAWRMLLGD